MKKILSNPKTSYVFTTEIKKLFYALIILILGVRICLLKNAFSFDAIFNLPVYEIALFSVIFLILFRLFINFFTSKKTLSLYAVFVFDVLAVYLRFAKHLFVGDHFSDRILFLCLTVLTLVSLQEILIEKNTGAFPFHYFLLLALLVFVLPVKQTPIDWSYVKHMMEAASEGAQNTFYSIESIFQTKSFGTGYGSFSVTGGKLNLTTKKQLILTTSETPYHVFYDKDSGKRKIVKKTLYLPGTHEDDKGMLVDFLSLLHANEIDEDTAALYSKISEMDIEYIYLKTEDEIAPYGSVLINGDSSATLHKKGYTLHTIYLDIDYGSPYLTAMYQNKKDIAPLSYADASDYAKELYRIDLSRFISESEYDAIVNRDAAAKDTLDTKGTTAEMKALAEEITKDCPTDFEKCVAIETYLRQFPYTTDAVGGYNQDSTMETPEGMADIANRFLFETKEGYCVHYTSSMVTLLRLCGIPAKAVMGYRYDFPVGSQMEYIVTADCAHTWPEAYIKNVGWVPFEPTGVYPSATLRSWRKTAEGDPDVLPAYEENSSEDEFFDNSAQITERKTKMAKVIGILIGSLVALVLLVLFFTVIIKNLCYRFATPEKRLKTDVEQIKKYLSRLVDEPGNDRGLYFDYVSLAPEKMKDDVKKVVSVYYRSLYGSTDHSSVSEAESYFAKNLRKDLKKVHKEA